MVELRWLHNPRRRCVHRCLVVSYLASAGRLVEGDDAMGRNFPADLPPPMGFLGSSPDHWKTQLRARSRDDICGSFMFQKMPRETMHMHDKLELSPSVGALSFFLFACCRHARIRIHALVFPMCWSATASMPACCVQPPSVTHTRAPRMCESGT